MTMRDDTPPDPHEIRLNRARERMSSDYDDAPPAADTATGRMAADPLTRRLIYAACGLGALMVLGVGGWALIGHHQHGIPVLGPPDIALREKPANPGGMQMDDMMMAPTESTGTAVHPAPPPEQPDPAALAARYGDEDKKPAESKPSSTAAVAEPPADQAAEETPPGETPPSQPGEPAEAAPGEQAPTEPAATTPAASPLPDEDKTKPAKPTGEPAATPDDAKPSAKPSPKPAAAEPVKTSASGPYGVQLAALNSEAAAMQEWSHVKALSPDLFADRSPVVEKVTRGTAVFYRLRVKGFDSIAATQSFCAQIRQHGHACNPLRP